MFPIIIPIKDDSAQIEAEHRRVFSVFNHRTSNWSGRQRYVEAVIALEGDPLRGTLIDRIIVAVILVLVSIGSVYGFWYAYHNDPYNQIMMGIIGAIMGGSGGALLSLVLYGLICGLRFIFTGRA